MERLKQRDCSWFCKFNKNWGNERTWRSSLYIDSSFIIVGVRKCHLKLIKPIKKKKLIVIDEAGTGRVY